MGLLPVKAPLHPDAIAGFEKVAAGPAIQKMGQDRQWTTEDVLNFYQKKDPEAIKIMNSVIASIAHSVYAMICMIDPHKIVFGDRKSTRLNSSHVAISYAVFCLKKTKKDTS